MTAPFDLVLFDLGGVIFEFDFEAMDDVWLDAGLDGGPWTAYYRSAYEPDADPMHPLHRAERGELMLAEFLSVAEPDAPGISHAFDAARPTALGWFTRPSPSWAALVREIGDHGLETGALTNTTDGMDVHALGIHRPELYHHLAGLFGDAILESHVIGVRKPSRTAFETAAEHFQVPAERILFVDDHASNCDGAAAAGLTPVHCSPGRDAAAQQQVRQLLGLVG